MQRKVFEAGSMKREDRSWELGVGSWHHPELVSGVILNSFTCGELHCATVQDLLVR